MWIIPYKKFSRLRVNNAFLSPKISIDPEETTLKATIQRIRFGTTLINIIFTLISVYIA